MKISCLIQKKVPLNMLSASFILFLYAQYCSSENLNNALNGNLITVIVIYRHGARTPINPYPNDPYKDSKYWPVGFGQLTNEGKEQEYALGQWLRQRYNTFLPEKYSEKDIYVRSTDVDRTLMSAEVNLAGVYPPDRTEMWNVKIDWQPIPVHTLPEKEDPVLAMKKTCPKYDQLVKQLNKDPYIADINKRNHDLYSYLTRNTGRYINSLTELEYIYSTLKIENENNLTLPKWTNNVFPDKLKPLAEFAFALPCYTKEMTRLKVGPLFNEINQRLQNATNTTLTNPKFYMYSAHDTTIANVLKGFDLFEPHAPPFSAMILIELYRNETDYYLNLLYKNSTVPQHMVLKGCDFNCPMDVFTKLIDSIAINVDDWRYACKTSFLPFNLMGDVIILTVIFLSLFAISCIVISIMFTRRRKNKMTYLRLPDDEHV